jgi:hypothetical protein
VKECTQCKEAKTPDAFTDSPLHPGGKLPRCKACRNVNARKYRKEKPEIARGCVNRWREKHPAKLRESREKSAGKNAEAVKAWWAANPGKRCAYQAKRRSTIRSRTVTWCDTAMVDAVYAYAKYVEQVVGPCHVDHIVPLQGALACGLHTHHNLRVITAEENKRKHNLLRGDEAEVTPAYLEPGFVLFMKGR